MSIRPVWNYGEETETYNGQQWTLSGKWSHLDGLHLLFLSQFLKLFYTSNHFMVMTERMIVSLKWAPRYLNFPLAINNIVLCLRKASPGGSSIIICSPYVKHLLTGHMLTQALDLCLFSWQRNLLLPCSPFPQHFFISWNQIRMTPCRWHTAQCPLSILSKMFPYAAAITSIL